MSKVYVIQKQLVYNKDAGALVSKFDFSLGEDFGELVFLLSSSAAPFDPDSILLELSEKLKDYSDEDFLLLVGNPCFIGWATAIAAQNNNGNVKLLQWSGRNKQYIPIDAKIF